MLNSRHYLLGSSSSPFRKVSHYSLSKLLGYKGVLLCVRGNVIYYYIVTEAVAASDIFQLAWKPDPLPNLVTSHMHD